MVKRHPEHLQATLTTRPFSFGVSTLHVQRRTAVHNVAIGLYHCITHHALSRQIVTCEELENI